MRFVLHLALCVAAAGCCRGLAQGTFVNLGFEAPILPLVSTNPIFESVPITRALPGWSGYIGTTQVSEVLYNQMYLGSATLALLDRGTPRGFVLDGNYTVVLQPGRGPVGMTTEPTSIAQVGTVPPDAGFLQFMIDSFATPFSVSFAGQSLAPVAVRQINPYCAIYRAGVGALAGRTGELRFTALTDNYPWGNELYLDSIEFVIPEPSSLGLLGAGAWLFGLRSRRKGKL
jgi:hypothetical protein